MPLRYGTGRCLVGGGTDYPHGAPGIVRELLLSGLMVCDPVEAEQAIAWAQAHPNWIEEPGALVIEDPNR